MYIIFVFCIFQLSFFQTMPAGADLSHIKRISLYNIYIAAPCRLYITNVCERVCVGYNNSVGSRIRSQRTPSRTEPWTSPGQQTTAAAAANTCQHSNNAIYTIYYFMFFIIILSSLLFNSRLFRIRLGKSLHVSGARVLRKCRSPTVPREFFIISASETAPTLEGRQQYVFVTRRARAHVLHAAKFVRKISLVGPLRSAEGEGKPSNIATIYLFVRFQHMALPEKTWFPPLILKLEPSNPTPSPRGSNVGMYVFQKDDRCVYTTTTLQLLLSSVIFILAMYLPTYLYLYYNIIYYI